MKRMPIGVSDYKTIIEEDYYYVDKTTFIKEILTRGGQVTIIPRPRRFGKTLNLSMLRYFFERREEDNSHLFSNTAIWSDSMAKAHFGQYPVIFLTFKAIKQMGWQDCYEKIANIIAAEFSKHRYLITNKTESDIANKFNAILNQTAKQTSYEDSLLFLSELLCVYHKKKVIVLIDEYDAPIHAAYVNGYYETLIGFIRNLFTAVLKDNTFLQFGVVTGILRAAKEGIFSGLNNPLISTILSAEFQDKFGFTESEVKALLNDQNLSSILPDVKEWYDGYTFRDTQIYNPWSIISCAYQRGDLKPYWLPSIGPDGRTQDDKEKVKYNDLMFESIKKIVASSNRESGYGRYDIMLMPRQLDKLGIIIEFKKVAEKETLNNAADEALAQIKERHYAAQLQKRGIKAIQLVGIAFEGKKIMVKSERI